MLPEAVQSIGSIWLSASNMIMELIFNAFIQGKAGLVKGKAKRQYGRDLSVGSSQLAKNESLAIKS